MIEVNWNAREPSSGLHKTIGLFFVSCGFRNFLLECCEIRFTELMFRKLFALLWWRSDSVQYALQLYHSCCYMPILEATLSIVQCAFCPSLCLTICLYVCNIRAPNSKTKKCREIKICTDVPQGTNKWSAIFQLKGQTSRSQNVKNLHSNLASCLHMARLSSCRCSGANCTVGVSWNFQVSHSP